MWLGSFDLLKVDWKMIHMQLYTLCCNVQVIKQAKQFKQETNNQLWHAPDMTQIENAWKDILQKNIQN